MLGEGLFNDIEVHGKMLYTVGGSGLCIAASRSAMTCCDFCSPMLLSVSPLPSHDIIFLGGSGVVEAVYGYWDSREKIWVPGHLAWRRRRLPGVGGGFAARLLRLCRGQDTFLALGGWAITAGRSRVPLLALLSVYGEVLDVNIGGPWGRLGGSVVALDVWGDLLAVGYVYRFGSMVSLYRCSQEGLEYLGSRLFDRRVRSIAFLGGDLVAVGLENGYVKLYETRDLSYIVESIWMGLDIPEGRGLAAAVAGSGAVLAVADRGGWIRLYISATRYSRVDTVV